MRAVPVAQRNVKKVAVVKEQRNPALRSLKKGGEGHQQAFTNEEGNAALHEAYGDHRTPWILHLHTGQWAEAQRMKDEALEGAGGSHPA